MLLNILYIYNRFFHDYEIYFFDKKVSYKFTTIIFVQSRSIRKTNSTNDRQGGEGLSGPRDGRIQEFLSVLGPGERIEYALHRALIL